ncbi:hypothetical protein ACUOBA_44430, partial [Escherichia coli]
LLMSFMNPPFLFAESVARNPHADFSLLAKKCFILYRAVNRCGQTLQKFFVEQGVWIRPFGKLIYLMPPYIILPQQLQRLTAAVNRAVQDETFFCQ